MNSLSPSLTPLCVCVSMESEHMWPNVCVCVFGSFDVSILLKNPTFFAFTERHVVVVYL